MDPVTIGLIISAVSQGLKFATQAAELAGAYQRGEIADEDAKRLLFEMQVAFKAGDDAWIKAGEPESA